jgi:hypothetical protein
MMEVVGLWQGSSRHFNIWLWSEAMKLIWKIYEDDKTLIGGACHTPSLYWSRQASSMRQDLRVRRFNEIQLFHE